MVKQYKALLLGLLSLSCMLSAGCCSNSAANKAEVSESTQIPHTANSPIAPEISKNASSDTPNFGTIEDVSAHFKGKSITDILADLHSPDELVDYEMHNRFSTFKPRKNDTVFIAELSYGECFNCFSYAVWNGSDTITISFGERYGGSSIDSFTKSKLIKQIGHWNEEELVKELDGMVSDCLSSYFYRYMVQEGKIVNAEKTRGYAMY